MAALPLTAIGDPTLFIGARSRVQPLRGFVFFPVFSGLSRVQFLNLPVFSAYRVRGYGRSCKWRAGAAVLQSWAQKRM
ncbi:hypothetical protein TMES_06020 [Thalassospira mesophila]|uniref:Uncharacterized protein n=1 Tax=Thalassospira mesophila TaxID=1293891 RepID=A0A1Y2L316_9PROT|nr:hypothetical protein TMES_06020 [Thalassospira mesophila]